MAAVAAVLSEYPAEVVSRVIDPRTGLPGRQRFPPDPFEVRQACEAEVARQAPPVAALIVFVARDSAEGRAWDAHERAQGRRVIWREYGPNAESGRRMPTRWPPGQSDHQAAGGAAA